MRPKQVVRNDRRFVKIAVTRCEVAVHVSAIHYDKRLVDRRPHRYPVAESVEHVRGVVAKPIRDVAIEPATAVIERSRQIPMIERDVRDDVGREKLVDQPRVEVEPGIVDSPSAIGKNAAPRNAEPISLKPDLAHELDVGLISIVVVAGNVAGVTVRRHSRRVREAMPDAWPRSIGKRRSFDLIGRRRSAPQKIRRKLDVLTHSEAEEQWRA